MFEVNELIRAVSGRIAGGIKSTGIKGVSIDTRTIHSGDAFIAIKGDNFDGHCFIDEAIKKGAVCVITKKAQRLLPPSVCFIEVADTTAALADIARHHRKKLNPPVIAITGSNGKTTTKDMIAWVLEADFQVLKNEGTKNNHIGLPLTLLKLNAQHDFVAVELGSNHPGEIDHLADICSPNMAVITNIGQSHLEAFGDLRGVFKEKISLLEHLTGPRIAIMNSDNIFLNRFASSRKDASVFTYGTDRPADFFAVRTKSGSSRVGFVLNKKYKFSLKTPGSFNIHNALAAISAARMCGMDYPDISERLTKFSFPPGRLNLIEKGAVKFIDDTYNSNPFSLECALQALEQIATAGRKIFVMGDMLELGEGGESFHRRAGDSVARVCDAFIGVGKLSKKSAQQARRSGLAAKNLFTCDNSAQARDILFNKMRPGPGDVVLVKGSRSMRMEAIFGEEK